MKARMKSRLSRRIITFLGCIVAAGAASAATTDTWNFSSEEPVSWFANEDYWSQNRFPTNTENVTIAPSDTKKARVYVPENVEIGTFGDLLIAKKNAQLCELTICPGAKLTFTGKLWADQLGGTTSRVVVNGGTLRGGSYQPGATGTTKCECIVTNGGAVSFSASTTAWLGPADIYVEDSTFDMRASNYWIFGNHGTYAAKLFGKHATITMSGLGAFKLGHNGLKEFKADVILTDRSKMTTGVLTMGSGYCNSLLLTNSVFSVESDGESTFGNTNVGPSDGKTNVVVLADNSVFSGIGHWTVNNNLALTVSPDSQLLLTNIVAKSTTWKSTIVAGARQVYDFNGTVRVKDATTGYGKLYFPSLAGELVMRQTNGTVTADMIEVCPTGNGTAVYELSGGTLSLCGSIADSPGQGSSDFVNNGGRNAKLVLKGTNQEYRCRGIASSKLQIVYEIDKTGFNPIKMQSCNGKSSYDWISGLMTVKLTGGLQLLHTNAVELVHSYLLSGIPGASNGENAFADPNPQLWTFGPHKDDKSIPYGPFTGTGKMGVILTNEAEIAAGVLYDAGRSCGWLKLPKVREALEKPAKVSLDLVPQGDVTLQELIDGFTAAGYPAKALPAGGDYNVQLEVAPELVQAKNPDETIVFDFNEYPDGTACLNGTPTVRALVRRANVEVPQKGLILLLR